MKSTFIALFVTLLSLNISSARAENEIGFLCHAETDDFSGYFQMDTRLEGFLSKKENQVILSGYDFEYNIYDNNDIWSQASVRVDTEVVNDANYRPRVYKNHYKFDLSKGIFGTVTFLVPFNAFQSKDDRFEAVLIMTNIDDHAGDSVFLNCSID